VPIGELSSLVVAGVDVAHQLCKAGVRGSIPLVSTALTSANGQLSMPASASVTPDRTRVAYAT